MEQLLSAFVAICLGLAGVAGYFYGSNFIIDRLFADNPPSFSVADFTALLAAVVILVAFLWMPWLAEPALTVQGDAQVEVTNTYTGSSLLGTSFENADESAASTAQLTLILVPVGAAIGIAFAFWGLFVPTGRGISAIGTTFGGLVALGYFPLTFALGRNIPTDLASVASLGFWVTVIGAVVLILQVVIPRPIYTPPASDMVVQINTATRKRIRPWLFLGPALLAISLYLLYPAVDTLRRSFLDRRSVEFVGFENYQWLFTDEAALTAFRNNILWLLVVPFFSVLFGLLVAVLADYVRWENVAKSLIFMPMAISFVGASVVWRFVYHFNPPSRPQVGLLNAVVVALGSTPHGWFIERPLNNFFLMVILIWVQAGFAMVLISAALKNVPDEIIEAARIDGANEVNLFFRIILPQILNTILVVYTTIVIVVLKVFDIVFAMTGGQFDTEVLANQMFVQMFRFGHFGRGSAIAVILIVAVLPVMLINIRRFRRGEALR